MYNHFIFSCRIFKFQLRKTFKFVFVLQVKVHLTPKFFFAKIIRLILWSNLAQKFFDLVESLTFLRPVKTEFQMVHDRPWQIWGELKL